MTTSREELKARLIAEKVAAMAAVRADKTNEQAWTTLRAAEDAFNAAFPMKGRGYASRAGKRQYAEMRARYRR